MLLEGGGSLSVMWRQSLHQSAMILYQKWCQSITAFGGTATAG